jgi:UDPglucose--hexose-1-phosphate uridylyltransferase
MSTTPAPVIPGPHRRYNPLTGEWLLVSAGRTDRPWQGAVGTAPAESRPRYDPECYLCPGNRRAGGVANPDYATTFVFTNDFAALRPDTGDARVESGLLRAEGEPGTCRVVCFSPRHDLTLADMADDDVRRVVDLWAGQTAELGERYTWVQVFENRGEMMGASNPHPHGQIWAGTALPVEPAKEDARQREHLAAHGSRLLADYARQEAGGPRVVLENQEWLVLVPFWAAWPFETLVVPKAEASRLPDLDDGQRRGLVDVLRRLLARYDAVFDAPFPYSMGWHGAPYGGADPDHWVVHAHFYPPLLRSATVRKFMVGYELLAETQRDITAEEAAARLAALPDKVHA